MLADKGEVPQEEYTLPIGVADIKRQGTDVTLICWSKMVKLCMNAAQELEQQHGIDAEVLDLRTLRPLDEQTVIQSIRKTHRCVIVDEDWSYCGIGAGIMERIYKKVFDDLDAPIGRVSSEDVPVPYNHYLELAMQPSVEKVIAAVREVCYV
jgi:pyruvate dehydrogenase E1 component beta subunit